MNSCKCKQNEGLNCYISSFHRLSAKNPIRIGSSSQFKIEELFEFSLLYYASLSEALPTNSKLRLVGKQEEKNEGTMYAEKVFTLELQDTLRLSLINRRLSVSTIGAS